MSQLGKTPFYKSVNAERANLKIKGTFFSCSEDIEALGYQLGSSLMTDPGKVLNDAKNMETRKTGGSVSKGKSYLIGENGQEIFRPNTAGTIIPNHRTEQIVKDITPSEEGKAEIIQMDLGTEKDTPPEQPPMSVGITNIMKDINSVNPLNPYMNDIKKKYKIKI